MYLNTFQVFMILNTQNKYNVQQNPNEANYATIKRLNTQNNAIKFRQSSKYQWSTITPNNSKDNEIR